MTTNTRKTQKNGARKPNGVGGAETPLPEGLVQRAAARASAKKTIDVETLELMSELLDRVIIEAASLYVMAGSEEVEACESIISDAASVRLHVHDHLNSRGAP